MSDRDVLVSVSRVYGANLIRPANDLARQLCELVGKKTFTPRDVERLKAQGYTFTVQAPALPTI